jgi:hypothetical protein
MMQLRKLLHGKSKGKLMKCKFKPQLKPDPIHPRICHSIFTNLFMTSNSNNSNKRQKKKNVNKKVQLSETRSPLMSIVVAAFFINFIPAAII